MICSLSQMNDQSLKPIKDLEGELGKTLLAFSCHKLNPSGLSDAQLDKIQKLEKKLGVSIVAVDV